MNPLEHEIAQLIIECTGLEDMQPEEIDPVAVRQALGDDPKLNAAFEAVALVSQLSVPMQAQSPNSASQRGHQAPSSSQGSQS